MKSLLAEFLLFLKTRKKLWAVPLLIFIAAIAALIFMNLPAGTLNYFQFR